MKRLAFAGLAVSAAMAAFPGGAGAAAIPVTTRHDEFGGWRRLLAARGGPEREHERRVRWLPGGGVAGR